MEKIIFNGPERSGKTRKALEIYEAYSNKERLFINGQVFKNFSKIITRYCLPDTKLIIIDDPMYNASLGLFFNANIRIDKGKKSFSISPLIIITTNIEILGHHDSYRIVHFPNQLSIAEIVGHTFLDGPLTIDVPEEFFKCK